MIMAKTYGFNTVRSIAGLFRPEQLDICDEIGLLVYEECMASWQLGEARFMLENVDNKKTNLIVNKYFGEENGI